MQNDEKANYNQNFNNSTPQYANGSPWQHPYGVNQQNNQNSAPAWNGNEYSYKPQTQPYNHLKTQKQPRGLNARLILLVAVQIDFYAEIFVRKEQYEL